MIGLTGSADLPRQAPGQKARYQERKGPGSVSRHDDQIPPKTVAEARNLVGTLLREHGSTYAQEAGIHLRDEPGPLFQLLALASLLSARISASVAVAAARELFDAGLVTASAMAEASWQSRVDALGRGHYKRYDERTSTMLGDAAHQCLDRWNGDLRTLHREGGTDVSALRALLMEFSGIGPIGADIFLREVQAVWTDLPLLVDARVKDGARRLGLSTDADGLADLAGGRRVELVAALVRVSLRHDLADQLNARVSQE